MNNNLNNNGNIEDYEDLAVRKSKIAKKTAIAVGGVMGAGALTGGAIHAATVDDDNDDLLADTLSDEQIINGANSSDDLQPAAEAPTQHVTTEYVHVEQPVAEAEPAASDDMEITWDETTNYYVGDDKVMSMETGTIDGHKFMLADIDGDDHADILAIDMDNNGQFDDNEYMAYTPEDHIHMGHNTARTNNEHLYADLGSENGNGSGYAYTEEEDGPVHNNFEDEKTGEEYHGDLAENNPDYNPEADMDYSAETNYMANNDTYGYDDEPNVDGEYNDLASMDELGDDSFVAGDEADDFMA